MNTVASALPSDPILSLESDNPSFLPVDPERAKWLSSLTIGDQVWWVDPDFNACTGFYRVTAIPNGLERDGESVLVLGMDSGFEWEAAAADVFPARPSPLLPIVNAACERMGWAYTEDAIPATIADPFNERVIENVVREDHVQLADGSYSGPAWLVTLARATGRVMLTLEVTYALNGTSVIDLADRLHRELDRAIGEGFLSGETPATVDEYSFDTVIIEEPVTETEVAEFFRRHIQNGDLSPDDIPARLAQYGLMDPGRFQNEINERMAQAEIAQ